MIRSLLRAFPILLAASAMSQSVTSVELAKDNGRGKPGVAVKGFSTTDNPIHCRARFSRVFPSTIFAGELIAVNARGAHDRQVAKTNITGVAGTETVDFKFSLGKAWPVGSYKVVVKVNGKALRDVSFEIR